MREEDLIRRLEQSQRPLPEGFEARRDTLLRRLIREEEIVTKKKLSLAMVMALILALAAIGAALAAGLGVFGQLAAPYNKEKLEKLDSLSQSYQQSVTLKAEGEFPETVAAGQSRRQHLAVHRDRELARVDDVEQGTGLALADDLGARRHGQPIGMACQTLEVVRRKGSERGHLSDQLHLCRNQYRPVVEATDDQRTGDRYQRRTDSERHEGVGRPPLAYEERRERRPNGDSQEGHSLLHCEDPRERTILRRPLQQRASRDE